jgi:hypothetical protein
MTAATPCVCCTLCGAALLCTTPAAQNTDATAFQHGDTLYILWLSQKMSVSTAFQVILSKTVNQCLIMSLQFKNPFLLPLSDCKVKEHLKT